MSIEALYTEIEQARTTLHDFHALLSNDQLPETRPSRNGFLTLTPVPAKSAVFLVTTVKPLISAIAAICLSISCPASGTRSRPHT